MPSIRLRFSRPSGLALAMLFAAAPTLHAAATLTPASFDFGTVAVGDSVQTQIHVTGEFGIGLLTPHYGLSGTGLSIVGNTCPQVASGPQDCFVTVRWAPTAPISGPLGSTSFSLVSNQTTFSGTAIDTTLVVDTTSDANLTACDTAQPGDCSLRGAINRANAAADANTIAFAIPMSDAGCNAGTGVCRIVRGSHLPSLTGPTRIDGYTQPGAAPNTIPAPGANDARLKIEVTGIASDASNGVFTINTDAEVTIRGLAVFAPGAGAIRSTGGAHIVLRGNWFGVDAAGQTPDYTASGSVLNLGLSNRVLLVGGPTPAERNVIAGSGRDPDGRPGGGNTLRANSAPTSRGRILLQGNLFGLAPDGVTPLPFRDQLDVNPGDDANQTPQVDILDNRFVRPVRSFSGSFGGVLRILVSRSMDETAKIQGNVFGLGVDGSRIGVERDHIEVFLGNSSRVPRLLIGGLGAGEGNTFAAGIRQIGGSGSMMGTAVFLPSGNVSTFVELVGNTMLGNAGLGLDFPHGNAVLGRTLNDAGDADTGANGWQNHPKIETFSVSGNTFSVGYRVDSLPAHSAYPLRVDFYRSLGDEGEILLDSDVYTEAQAQTLRTVALTVPPGVTLDEDDVLVAIATTFDGRSSEFSFDTATLAISELPPESKAGLPLEVEVIATALTGPFKPNGVVRVSINTSPAASCDLTLEPAIATHTAAGRCTLIPLQSGNHTLTATLDTLQSAFANDSGGNPVATASVTLLQPGPEQVGFTSCRAVALEGRDLVLSIGRPSGGIETVQVNFSHEAGSATPGVDYTAPADQLLIWLPGDFAPKQIVVPIASDGTGEPVETFRLRLSDPIGVAIQPHALIEVTILDGDEQGFRDGFEGDCPQ